MSLITLLADAFSVILYSAVFLPRISCTRTPDLLRLITILQAAARRLVSMQIATASDCSLIFISCHKNFGSQISLQLFVKLDYRFLMTKRRPEICLFSPKIDSIVSPGQIVWCLMAKIPVMTMVMSLGIFLDNSYRVGKYLGKVKCWLEILKISNPIGNCSWELLL